MFEWVLALLLGLALLFKALQWYGAHLDRLSRGSGIPTAAPRPAVRAVPPPSPTPPPAAAAPAPDEESQPGLIPAGVGAAFSVGPSLYATAESLSDGYGHLSGMRVQGALITGRVVAHDRARSGVAIVAIPDALPSLSLVTSASLRPGQRIRALYPAAGVIQRSALPIFGVFKGIVMENGVVRLAADLQGSLLLKGAPILDDDGRVVGIVVSRRDDDNLFFVAA